jgi:hypothetical protein
MYSGAASVVSKSKFQWLCYIGLKFETLGQPQLPHLVIQQQAKVHEISSSYGDFVPPAGRPRVAASLGAGDQKDLR